MGFLAQILLLLVIITLQAATLIELMGLRRTVAELGAAIADTGRED